MTAAPIAVTTAVIGARTAATTAACAGRTGRSSGASAPDELATKANIARLGEADLGRHFHARRSTSSERANCRPAPQPRSRNARASRCSSWRSASCSSCTRRSCSPDFTIGERHNVGLGVAGGVPGTDPGGVPATDRGPERFSEVVLIVVELRRRSGWRDRQTVTGSGISWRSGLVEAVRSA